VHSSLRSTCIPKSPYTALRLPILLAETSHTVTDLSGDALRILSSYAASTSAPSSSMDVYTTSHGADAASSLAMLVSAGLASVETYHTQEVEDMLRQAHTCYKNGDYKTALNLCNTVSLRTTPPACIINLDSITAVVTQPNLCIRYAPAIHCECSSKQR
jgi:hypothetical protein